jgi:hypothetical protein
MGQFMNKERQTQRVPDRFSALRAALIAAGALLVLAGNTEAAGGKAGGGGTTAKTNQSLSRSGWTIFTPTRMEIPALTLRSPIGWSATSTAPWLMWTPWTAFLHELTPNPFTC